MAQPLPGEHPRKKPERHRAAGGSEGGSSAGGHMWGCALPELGGDAEHPYELGQGGLAQQVQAGGQVALTRPRGAFLKVFLGREMSRVKSGGFF